MKRAAPPQILSQTQHGRTLLFTFASGEGVPAHRHPKAKVTLAVLEGEIEVTTDKPHQLSAGETLTHAGSGEITLLAHTAGRVLVCLLSE